MFGRWLIHVEVHADLFELGNTECGHLVCRVESADVVGVIHYRVYGLAHRQDFLSGATECLLLHGRLNVIFNIILRFCCNCTSQLCSRAREKTLNLLRCQEFLHLESPLTTFIAGIPHFFCHFVRVCLMAGFLTDLELVVQVLPLILGKPRCLSLTF